MRAWLFLVFAGCSSTFVIAPDDGRGRDASTPPPDASSDVAVVKDTGAADVFKEDAFDGDACAQQLEQIGRLREQIGSCTPNGADQCGQEVEDICCELSVTVLNEPVIVFQNQVRAYKKSCGPIACPPVECPPAPSKICESTGRCR